jgi:hypothetical protein
MAAFRFPRFVGLGLFSCILFLLGPSAWAMPNFARKFNLDCQACHTPAIPKLNEMGYNFRAAGYRPPAEIGNNLTSKEIGDYFTARTQASIDYSTSTTQHATGPDTKSESAQLTFREVTLYPLSGAYGKRWSSLVEVSDLPEDYLEIENAYVRGTFGHEQNFWTARFGIFHPFEGYGASDRPLGLSRPLIQTTSSNYNGSTFFTPWGFDEMGAELGYTHKRFSARLALFNGIYYDSGENKAFPAQGGELSKPAGPSFNAKDGQLFLNYVLTDNGGGVSAYAYLGDIDLPEPGGGGGVYLDAFQRYSLYASYPIRRFLLLAGALSGTDDYFNTNTNANGDVIGKDGTFASMGFFGEADYGINENCAVGARFDQFDPQSKDTNIKDAQQAVSVFANVPLNNGLQFIGEYRYKNTERGVDAGGSTLTKKDNAAQIRMIYIF